MAIGQSFKMLTNNVSVRVLTKSKPLASFSKSLCGSAARQYSSDAENERQKTIMARGLPKRRELEGVSNIVLVASGKGGVGKSTTAVNIALAMANLELKRVGLLDADIYGPSIPIMMNLSGQPFIDETNKMIPMSNYNVKCMSMGFLIRK